MLVGGTRHDSLRFVSHQNHIAAIKIQKVLRGHRKRLELWKYGGKLMVSRVVRIQRCYRGLQGRRRAAEVYRQKILMCAHKIQGMYYRWHSRRQRLRSHLNFLNRGVTLLQSYFRMRAAVYFTNLVRRALHNKKAGYIQRQVRRLLGLRRGQERKRRFRFIYDRLLRQIRETIQQSSGDAGTHTDTDETVTDNSESPMFLLCDESATEHGNIVSKPQSQREDQVEAFEAALCNLLALGKYEVVRQLGSHMVLTASSEACHQHETHAVRTPGCVGTESELALTAVYLGLSACWTRAGKMRFTRADYMEEALGLMMQHSAVALIKAQRVVQRVAGSYNSGMLSIDEPFVPFMVDTVSAEEHEHGARKETTLVAMSDISGLPSDPNALPAWLLAMEEEVVDLYYMSILSMHGVTSPFDAMLLTADWVWYQACVHEHNAAAEDMVLMAAAGLRASIRAKAEASERAEDELDSPATARSAEGNGTPSKAEPHTMADLVVARARGEVKEVTEAPPAYIDPAYAEHEQRMHEAAFRRNFAVRRVYGLLHRAKKLLSEGSLDRKEIGDRLDLFHDLHMTEHRTLLFDAKGHAMPFRTHFYTPQQTVDLQRNASMVAASAKLARTAGASGTATPTWAAGQTGNGSLEVDLQVIQCGKTILVKGSVLLHRLVEAVDDLPPGCTVITSPKPARASILITTKSRKSRSSKAGKTSRANRDPHEGEEEVPVQVAVRPFVLMRGEVVQLMDQINEELGILDIVGAAGHDEDGSEASTSLAGSTAGSLSQSETQQSQSQAGAEGAESNPKHQHRHKAHHHGFTVAECRRMADYLQQHLRLVSCQDSFVDPVLQQTVRNMRQVARNRLGAGSKYTFSTTDESELPTGVPSQDAVIAPGVPSVRFALPVIEYKRRIFNESQTVVHATYLLQRVYRGYRGRAKYRRMRWKRTEFERQAQHTLAVRAEHDAVRFWRGERLTVIQRLFRGFRWRKRLFLMRCASLVVQCAFRMHRARKMVQAERRRRTEGAPVVSMLGNGRGVQIGDFKFTLKVFRSGTNYRLEGMDFLRGVVYEGAVYTPDVMRLLRAHNAGIAGTSLYANSQRIMPWQHERVTELLVSNLGMMPKIRAVTTQLGARTPAQPTQYILVANRGASITTAPVQPPASAQQLYGSVSQPILELATAHTQKQRLQRYAQFRQERKFRRQATK